MRRRTSRFTSLALGLLAAIGPASGASAYWTAGGSGTASGSTGNLGSPTGVTATQPTSGVRTVRVTWTAPAAPSVAPAGYYVQRFAGATASPACGSSPTSLLPATTTACDDTGVAPGSYTYKVTAVLNSWTATSAPSGSVTVRPLVGAPSPTSGTAGSSVTISGSGFAAGSALTVKVGATTATITAGASTDANGSSSVTFTVPAQPAGAYTVTVTDAAGNTATSATSFTIVANPATKLAFTTQPASGANVKATGTGTFSASVAVQDASGNVRTTDNTTLVTLAIGTNPSAGVLACTNVGGVGPVTVTSGVANFTGCSITKVGAGYKLTATSSPALTAPVNANSFNITAGTAVGIVLSDITVSPTPALGAPTGAVGSLAYSSTGQGSNTGNVLTARISLADQNQNLVTNGTGSAITVGLAATESGAVSTSALSIANGASTSSSAFTLTRPNGTGKTVTMTATVGGTTQTLTVRMAS